jgi:glyoxylase-like metal-dependent hydrolase (beta-lactamase superfamily II)
MGKNLSTVIEVAPRIYRISLPHPYLDAANVYLICDESPALIDTGHFNSGASSVLAGALGKFGLRAQDLAYVFLTDVYPERVGGLLAWQDARAGNSKNRVPAVVAHRGARRAAADYGLYSAELCRLLLDPLEKDNRLAERLPIDAMSLLLSRAYHIAGSFPLAHPVASEASFPLGERTVYAVPLPGPSGYHMGYWVEPDGFLFSGDLTVATPDVLPFICPGQLGAPAGYANSLAWACGLTASRLLPATGEVCATPELSLQRMRRLLAQERDNIPALLLSGPRDLVTLLAFKTLGESLSPLLLLRRSHTLLSILGESASMGLIDALHDGIQHTYRLGPGSLLPYRSRAA